MVGGRGRVRWRRRRSRTPRADEARSVLRAERPRRRGGARRSERAGAEAGQAGALPLPPRLRRVIAASARTAPAIHADGERPAGRRRRGSRSGCRAAQKGIRARVTLREHPQPREEEPERTLRPTGRVERGGEVAVMRPFTEDAAMATTIATLVRSSATTSGTGPRRGPGAGRGRRPGDPARDRIEGEVRDGGNRRGDGHPGAEGPPRTSRVLSKDPRRGASGPSGPIAAAGWPASGCLRFGPRRTGFVPSPGPPASRGHLRLAVIPARAAARRQPAGPVRPRHRHGPGDALDDGRGLALGRPRARAARLAPRAARPTRAPDGSARGARHPVPVLAVRR